MIILISHTLSLRVGQQGDQSFLAFNTKEIIIFILFLNKSIIKNPSLRHIQKITNEKN